MPPLIPDLITPRLRLAAMTLSSLLAAEQGEAALAGFLKRGCAVGTIDPSFGGVVKGLTAATAADPGVAAWNRWIIEAAGGQVIGTIGFLSRPDEHGCVEVGYSIAPGSQKNGYATEAVGAMVAFAFAHPSVRLIRAVCREDNVGSIKVLERNGFDRTEELGPMVSWEKRRPKPGAGQSLN